MTGFTGPVVVGYHADSSGDDALALALLLGTRLDLPVIVTTVYAAPAPIGMGRVDAEWVAERRGAAEQVLHAAEQRVAAQGTAARVTFELTGSSSAARGLDELAARAGAAAIVVGSAETVGFERHVFIGSTAARLLSGSEIPVAVAPRGFAQRSQTLDAVGMAYIDTPEAKHALTEAADVSGRLGASLTLLTAIDDRSSTMPWLLGDDTRQAYRTTAAEAFQAAVDDAAAGVGGDASTGVSTRLLIGDIVAELADAEGVDLLFVGSRGHGPVRRVLLGGLSSRLMRRASMPVVVVPRPA